MKSITQYLKNPQTAVLSKTYGARLQKMYPEARMHLVSLVSSASLRNISILETRRTHDIPFGSLVAEEQYLRASTTLRDLPVDPKTAALFIKAVIQTIC